MTDFPIEVTADARPETIAREMHELIQAGPSSGPKRSYEELPETVKACGLQTAAWIAAKMQLAAERRVEPLVVALREVGELANQFTSPGAPEADAETLLDRLTAVEDRADAAISAHGHGVGIAAADPLKELLRLATRFELQERDGRLGLSSVTVERRPQRDGRVLWAVMIDNMFCLTKAGEAEHEPLPSSRDDAFLERARFASLEEALEAARAYIARVPEYKLLKTLVWYDGPQLILVESDGIEHVGVAVGEDNWTTWLFAPVLPERRDAIIGEKFDIVAAFRDVAYLSVGTFDAKTGDPVSIVRRHPDDIPADWKPGTIERTA